MPQSLTQTKMMVSPQTDSRVRSPCPLDGHKAYPVSVVCFYIRCPPSCHGLVRLGRIVCHGCGLGHKFVHRGRGHGHVIVRRGGKCGHGDILILYWNCTCTESCTEYFCVTTSSSDSFLIDFTLGVTLLRLSERARKREKKSWKIVTVVKNWSSST